MKGLKYLVIAGLLLALQADARAYKKAAMKAAPTYSVEALAVEEMAAPAPSMPGCATCADCPATCTPFITKVSDTCIINERQGAACIPVEKTITKKCLWKVDEHNTCCEMVDGQVVTPTCAPCCAPRCAPNCCKPCCAPKCAPRRCRTGCCR